MIRTYTTFLLSCFLTGPTWLGGQDTLQSATAPRPNVLVLAVEVEGISTLETETLDEYIRSEISATGSSTLVNRTEIETALEALEPGETGCTSDSCIAAIAGRLGATHALTWSLVRTGDTYTFVLRHMDVTDGPLTKKRVKKDYKGDVNGLVLSIQKGVWDVLSIQPPEGRFPPEDRWATAIQAARQKVRQARKVSKEKVAQGIKVLKEKAARIDRSYWIGAAALVVFGAMVGISISGEGPPLPADNIGGPPTFPEP
ncbi:MAG: hypothetical protein ACE5LH_08605 [Fidelibacterota bacterium]